MQNLKSVISIALFLLIIYPVLSQNELTLEDIFSKGKYYPKGSGQIRWAKNNKGYTSLEFNEETRTVLQHSGDYGRCLGELTVTWDGGEIIDRKLRIIKASKEMAPSKQVKAIAEKHLAAQQNTTKE